MTDKKFLALSFLFFLIFFAGVAVVTLEKPTSQILRAKNENPSPLKSFAVVFPQVTEVNKKVKVSVYIRDVNGSVLANRTVQLATNPTTVEITPSNNLTTDNIGMAQFFISSKDPGKIEIVATDLASNTAIASLPTVEFTQSQ